MEFPQSVEDFKKLDEEGKDVAYVNMDNEDDTPEFMGVEWHYWSTKRTPEKTEYVLAGNRNKGRVEGI